MKKNLPVTQREIDYPNDVAFVSKTDPKGIITYVNDGLVDIAGFTREELIGKPHNILRHPDMPEWAFKSLWDTVKSGHPWSGIVKNRAKNGDHYWVKASVTPIMENGVILGHLSFRRKPSRAEVAAAEALYKSNVVPSSRFSIRQWFNHLKLENKLQFVIQLNVLLMMILISVHTITNEDEETRLARIKQAEGAANEIINSANLLMESGKISDPDMRKMMITKASAGENILSVRLMRTEQVKKQFGSGLPEEQILDDVQRKAVETKTPIYMYGTLDGKTTLRAVTPYIVSHNFRGTDCLVCHQVEVGSVNGVSDISLDISESVAKRNHSILVQIFIQIAFQLVLFVCLRVIIHKFVAKPVKEIRQSMSDMVNGQMQKEIDISGRDEAGELMCSVQMTKTMLCCVIDQVRGVSKHIDKRSSALMDGFKEVSQSSNTQSDAASTMAAAIEEMSVSIDQISEHASEVKKVSDNSSSLAKDGSEVVQQVVSDMQKMNLAVTNTAHTIEQLGEQSDRIQSVVQVIKEIADQTNLLALNAAIEAARAGDQGRGFAVVADEVRKLAEKTGLSTEEIAGMIEEIRNRTRLAISEVVDTVKLVEAGSVLAGKAGTAITEINDGVIKVLAGVEDISSSIHEQSQTSHDIASNVEKVASLSDKNCQSVRSVVSQIEELSSYSQDLKSSIEHFKI